MSLSNDFVSSCKAFYDETDREGRHRVELQAGQVFVAFDRCRPQLAARWHDLAPFFGASAPMHLLLIAHGVRKHLGDDRVVMTRHPEWHGSDPLIASEVTRAKVPYLQPIADGVDLLA